MKMKRWHVNILLMVIFGVAFFILNSNRVYCAGDSEKINSVTVDFEPSQDSTQEKAVKIPDLKEVKKITIDNGYASLSPAEGGLRISVFGGNSKLGILSKKVAEYDGSSGKIKHQDGLNLYEDPPFYGYVELNHYVDYMTEELREVYIGEAAAKVNTYSYRVTIFYTTNDSMYYQNVYKAKFVKSSKEMTCQVYIPSLKEVTGIMCENGEVSYNVSDNKVTLDLSDDNYSDIYPSYLNDEYTVYIYYTMNDMYASAVNLDMAPGQSGGVVNIPNLGHVKSVTASNGTIQSFSVKGNNVTVSVVGGSTSNYWVNRIESKMESGYNTEFIAYDDATYKGILFNDSNASDTGIHSWTGKVHVLTEACHYNVNIIYAPKLDIKIIPVYPSSGGYIKNGEPLIPSIKVSGGGKLLLTCKCYFNGKVDEKNITNTQTEQLVTFSNMDVSTLGDGCYQIEYEVYDGDYVVGTYIEDFYIDKTPPFLSFSTTSNNENNISISLLMVHDKRDYSNYGGGYQYDKIDNPNSGDDNKEITEDYPCTCRYSIDNIPKTDWTSSNTYSENTFMPNTAHSVTVEAKDHCDNVTTQTQTVWTLAQMPSCTASCTGKDSANVVLSDSNPSGTQYQISAGNGMYVAQDGTLTGSAVWITPAGKSVSVKGLAPNTAYTFTAKARNGAAIETVFGTGAGITTLSDPPTGLNGVPQRENITLTWNPVPGVTGYKISQDGTPTEVIQGTSYTHYGLQPDTAHTYRVSAINGGGDGEWSTAITVKTLPNPPETPMNLSGQISNRSIAISWDPTARADSYDINIDGKVIQGYKGTSYAHTGLLPETTHTYSIAARNAGGISGWTTPIMKITDPDPPLTPANIKVSETQTEIKISWDTAERATEYQIEVDEEIKSTGTQPLYIHKELKADSLHKYRIRALNAQGRGISNWSEMQEIRTLPIPPVTPANITAISGGDGITISWDKVLYATEYYIELDGKTVVGIGDSNTYMHSGLVPDSKHSYRVKAKNRGGESEWSIAVPAFTMSNTAGGSGQENARVNIAAIAMRDSITLAWDEIKEADEYEIEVDGVVKSTGNGTMYEHKGLQPNTPHTYRVRTRNGDAVSSWCAVAMISTLPNPPDAPVNIKAYAVSTGEIKVSWDEISGATGYEVEVDGVVENNLLRTEYDYKGLEAGTWHTYRVRATNIGGATAWSPIIKISTVNPNYTIDCKKGEEVKLVLAAENLQDFNEKSFAVTYNPEELELSDLCEFTPEKEVMESGKIEGTDLTVEYKPGKIIITVKKPMAPGTMWKGSVDTIIFKSKIDGKTEVSYEIK